MSKKEGAAKRGPYPKSETFESIIRELRKRREKEDREQR